MLKYTSTHLIRLMVLAGLFALVVPVVSTLAQEAAPAATRPNRDTDADSESIFSLMVKGGPVMIPLGLASIIALAITFERALSLRRANLVPPGFLQGLKGAYDGDPAGLGQAIRYCETQAGPVGHIFKSGLVNMDRGIDAAEKAVEDAGAREVDKLKRSLRGLSIIASVSPLLGLLGTVYGMIEAFQKATQAGLGKADVLAGGIYEALVTTATGLTIAVPVLLIFQYYNSKVDAVVDDIDEMGIDFIEHIYKHRPKSQPGAQGAS